MTNITGINKNILFFITFLHFSNKDQGQRLHFLVFSRIISVKFAILIIPLNVFSNIFTFHASAWSIDFVEKRFDFKIQIN